MRVPRVPYILAAIGVAAPPLSGCGSSSSTLDTAPVEKAIARSILRQHNIQATVRCPPTVRRKAGVEFTCTANLQAGSYPIYATVRDSTGHVRYGNSAPLITINSAKVQRAIERSILTQRHLRAAVSCPAQVLQQARVSFTCTATVKGKQYPFAVTEDNANGHVRYEGLRVSGG